MKNTYAAQLNAMYKKVSEDFAYWNRIQSESARNLNALMRKTCNFDAIEAEVLRLTDLKREAKRHCKQLVPVLDALRDADLTEMNERLDRVEQYARRAAQ